MKSEAESVGHIQRRFTKEGYGPFIGIERVQRDSILYDSDGSVLVEIKDVEAPTFWSQAAIDVMAQKYFRKAGVPSTTKPHPDYDGKVCQELCPRVPVKEATFGREKSVFQVICRIVGHWAFSGYQQGYFASASDALRWHDEVAFTMIHQMAAPNSPQWFNTGLWWAYGIEGEKSGLKRISTDDECMETVYQSYKHPQVHACFIQTVEDELISEQGIFGLWTREARVFKFGGGSGSNFSRLRAKGEKLSAGGGSSGMMSFLDIGDAAAGSIKSGGTCLAPWTRVYTAIGPVSVNELAGREFVVVSYHPSEGRYKAKRATAWKSGRKSVVRVMTDKGVFDLSYDHPMKLAGSGLYVWAGRLKEGDRLWSMTTHDADGYVRVNLRDGRKGKDFFHRMVASDVMGYELSFPESVVDHIDGDKLNNDPANLRICSQSDHARRHGTESYEEGTHPFIGLSGRLGSENGMHTDSAFWSSEAAEAYRELKRAEMLDRDPVALQAEATKQRMLNIAWRCLNSGYQITTFDAYVKARKVVVGRIGSITRLREIIDKLFGSYDSFLEELSEKNHRVVSVESIGDEDVYAVEVECHTEDDKSPMTGHNYVIWSDDSPFGSGVVVSNTRRAAKMVVVDDDHPEVEKFITWKADEEKKVAAMVAGYKLIENHVQRIIDGTPGAASEALEAGVPKNYVEKAKLMRENDIPFSMPVLDDKFEGEAYQTVSGQNANNSVRLSNNFMRAVLEADTWQLHWRKDDKPPIEVDARRLWKKILESVWFSADPGIIFGDTMNAWNTCASDGEIEATNPCGEYCFLNDTGCNLASLRLTAFDADDGFDYETFAYVAELWTTVLDITVGMASYPSEAIAQGSFAYRTLGLGYADLGALLMQNGIPYASDEGRKLAANVTSVMTAASYAQSARLAGRMGAFPAYERNATYTLDVIKNHAGLAGAIEIDKSKAGWPEDYNPIETDTCDASKRLWRDAYSIAKKHGVRNAQTTLIAPTGTISFVMDCDTTGIEPDFAAVKFKKLAGGGYMKIVNRSIEKSLAKLGYKKTQIADITNYVIGAGTFVDAPHGFDDLCRYNEPLEEYDWKSCMDVRLVVKDWQKLGLSDEQWCDINYYVCGRMTVEGAPHLDAKHYPIFDCANTCGLEGKRFIAPAAHVAMMAQCQPFLSGAISKTINVPYDATIADVEDIHFFAWRSGVKDFALYRDRSKLSQPLNSSIDVGGSAPAIVRVVDAIERGIRMDLPNKRYGYTHKVKVDRQSVFYRTGEYEDGTLGEIFIDINKQGSQLRSWANMFAIAVSIGLQHGVPLSRFVESFVFTNFTPNGIVIGHDQVKTCLSVVDMIFRDLGINYLGRSELSHLSEDVMPEERADETDVEEKINDSIVARLKGYSGETCDVCHQMTLIRNGTCLKCDTCGSTTGCS